MGRSSVSVSVSVSASADEAETDADSSADPDGARSVRASALEPRADTGGA
jgi:hypothetical protein